MISWTISVSEIGFNTSTPDLRYRVVGGPDRVELMAQRSRQAPGGSSMGAVGGSSTTAASLAASAASAQASIYSKLSSALGERGQLLGGLEESFKSLEQGSQSMVTQVGLFTSSSRPLSTVVRRLRSWLHNKLRNHGSDFSVIMKLQTSPLRVSWECHSIALCLIVTLYNLTPSAFS